MKKGNFLILLFSLFIGAMFIIPINNVAYADDPAPCVSASTSSCCAGDWVYVSISETDFVDIAGIDVLITYDSTVFTIESCETQEILQQTVYDVNKGTIGEIRLSAISAEGITGDGTILTLCFSTKSDAQKGKYPIGIAVGDTYDKTLAPVSVRSQSGSVTVNERLEDLPTVYFYSNDDEQSYHYGDTVSIGFYTYDAQGFCCADFEIEYDEEILELQTLSLSSQLTSKNGAVYSVNKDIKGYAKVSYAALEECNGYSEIISLNFKIISNETVSTAVLFRADSIYKKDLSGIEGNRTLCRVRVEENENAFAPKIYIETKTADSTDFDILIYAEKDTELAAGDFYIYYDGSVFTCKSISSVQANAMVVGNPNYRSGQVRFSFICEDGISEKTAIAELSFSTTAGCSTRHTFSISGENVTDKDFNNIEKIQYGSGDITIGHILVHHTAKEPTCMEVGWTEYDTCSRCDYTTYNEVAALGHDLIHHKAKLPTCTEIGWTEYDTCSRCDYTTYDEIATLGHSYRHVITKPTCLEHGYTTHTCSQCGDSYVDSYVDPLGHDWVWVVDVPATRTSTGLKHEQCQRCDLVRNENTIIPIVTCDHVHVTRYNEIPADCLHSGKRAYWFCEDCRNYYSDESCQLLISDINTFGIISALGHDIVYIEGKAPTCIENGWDEYVICSRCEYTTYHELDSLGHCWGEPIKEWSDDHKTCTTKSICEVCGVEIIITTTQEEEAFVIDKTVEVDDGNKGIPLSDMLREANTVGSDGEDVKVRVTVGQTIIVFDAAAIAEMLDSNPVLFVETIKAEDSTFDNLPSNTVIVLEITLKGASFSGGSATVITDFSQEMPKGKVLKVYYIDENGEKTDMNATYADGKITFTTNHFSRYVVVFEDKGGLSAGAIAGIVVGCVVFVAGVAVGVFFLLKKKGVIGKKTDESMKKDKQKDQSNE